MTTHSTGLDVYWDPPPLSTINGEFLGYILTYRPAERYDKKVIEIRDESLKPQVIGCIDNGGHNLKCIHRTIR